MPFWIWVTQQNLSFKHHCCCPGARPLACHAKSWYSIGGSVPLFQPYFILIEVSVPEWEQQITGTWLNILMMLCPCVFSLLFSPGALQYFELDFPCSRLLSQNNCLKYFSRVYLKQYASFLRSLISPKSQPRSSFHSRWSHYPELWLLPGSGSQEVLETLQKQQVWSY